MRLMRVLTIGCFALLSTSVAVAEPIGMPADVDPQDWPWWRGPTRDGVAPCERAPIEWSEKKNVLWKVELPGRGHSSPTVVGERILLTTADEEQQIQTVLAYDRRTGRPLWSREIHRGKFDTGGHKRSSQASGTVASDGERLFVNFLNDGAVRTSALNLDGEPIWETKVSDFVNHQGFGSSPAIFDDLVLVTADHKQGGRICGLDRRTGKIVWKEDRPKKANYTSPTVLPIGGRPQMLVSGCDLVSSFDPLTGSKFWEVEQSTVECVGTMVSDGDRVFCSGGYPRNFTVAIEVDGGGVAWDNNTRSYVPSLLVHQDSVFAITDDGIATCYAADSGKVQWKQRLGGKFNASPILVGELIYAAAEDGRTLIFKASPTEYEEVAVNELGDEVFPTPAICGETIYLRLAKDTRSGRQEWLYAIDMKK